MIKVHIISDLHLEHNEFNDNIEFQIPKDTDLVVLNGNIGVLKRTMLYAETFCNLYPEVQFVVNLGETEKYRQHYKYHGEIEDSLEIRKDNNASWPKNLHWSRDNMIINFKNGQKVDILCTYGYPKIHSVECEWKSTDWFKHYVVGVTNDINDNRIYIPSETSKVEHGQLPIWATPEWINLQHDLEVKKVRKWELSVSCYKILVTHINPYKDSRCNNLQVSPYLIHLNNMLWITSNYKVENLKYLGARLVSNPGRGTLARSHVVTIID